MEKLEYRQLHDRIMLVNLNGFELAAPFAELKKKGLVFSHGSQNNTRILGIHDLHIQGTKVLNPTCCW